MKEAHFDILRRHMVEVVEIYADLAADELGKSELDRRVLDALHRVRRHRFVPDVLAAHAYENTPLPIGFDKTISQPFIVAVMTDLLAPEPDDEILEVGTGLGYQAAVLAELVTHVWTVEIIEELASEAEQRLAGEGCDNVSIRMGDGTSGWPEHAPFDKIIITAGAAQIPKALLEQLKPGGRMVLPVGKPDDQKLTLVQKGEDGDLRQQAIMPVRFGELEIVR